MACGSGTTLKVEPSEGLTAWADEIQISEDDDSERNRMDVFFSHYENLSAEQDRWIIFIFLG